MTTALLDTSVVLDAHDPQVIAALPDATAISAITAAELAAGPALAPDRAEASRRQVVVQQAESLYEPLPFDAVAARSFALIAGAVRRAGRKPRGRFADLLIAATAHANGLDLYTRNPGDFAGLEGLVQVVGV